MQQVEDTKRGFFSNYILMLPALTNLFSLRTIVQQQTLTLQNLSPLPVDSNPQSSADALFRQLASATALTSSDMWSVILSEFKRDAVISYLLVQGDCLCRVGVAFLIGELFDSLQTEKRWLSYLLVVASGFFWISQFIFSQIGLRRVQEWSIRLKASITLALYRKLLGVPACSLQGDEAGQIANAITQFHDILENRSIFLYIALSSPLAILGLTIMMVLRVGWFSLCGIVLSLLCEFIHYHFANYNSQNLESVSDEKKLRLGVVSEILGGFRYIKMQLWESMFLSKVLNLRKREKKGYLRYGAGMSVQIALSEGVSAASMLLIFGLAAKYDNTLNSKSIILAVLDLLMIKLLIIFSSYGVSCYYQIDILLQNLAQLFSRPTPKMLEISPSSQQNQASINNQQINKTQQFLEQPKPRIRSQPNIHLSANMQLEEDNSQTALRMTNFACYFNQDFDSCLLRGVNLRIKRGEFVGIFGKVGTGKSVLLNCLAQQSLYYSGQIKINSTISFLQQDPVIFSGTIRENILFGLPIVEDLYERAIDSSCFRDDLVQFTDKDLTVIHQGAANLSGGQRTRLALARVLYANRPLLLLDDPLSSLDTRVIQKVIKSLRKWSEKQKTTIILSTHQVHCLLKCSNVIEVKNKTTYSLTDQEMKRLRDSYGQQQRDIEDIEEEMHEQQQLKQVKQSKQAINQKEGRQEREKINVSLQKENQVIQTELRMKEQIVNINKKEEESQSKQSYTGFLISFLSYIYNNKWNWLVFTCTLLAYAISQSLYAFVIIFLNQYDKVMQGNSKYFENEHSFWLTLSIISVFIFIVQIIRTFLLSLSIQLANSKLHEDAIRNLLICRVDELDKLGSKGAMDRFSTDLGLLDVGIISQLSLYFIVTFIVIIQTIFIAVSQPIILVFAAALVIPIFFWNHIFAPVIITTKKVDLKLKGPVIGLFSETLKGLIQIDVLNAQKLMFSKITHLLQKSMQASLCYQSAFRVFQAYTLYFSNLTILVSLLVLIAMITDKGDILSFSFAVVFLVDINECIGRIVCTTVIINSNLVSVKRIMSLIQLPNQKEDRFALTQNKSLQQREGRHSGMLLKDLSLRYSQQGELALNKFSLQIKRGMRVAIVGRTGSGKSSLIQALYRLVEPQSTSTYLINGMNALAIPLQALRSLFTCIPQVPFFFNESLRTNLDPFNKFSEQDINKALSTVHMLETVQRLGGLSTIYEEGKLALSAGQKQLFCLARAILDRSDFLILDEATASIDHATDAVIQTVLRQRFAESTIISVAHRLQTILDYDMIVVLSRGKMIEVGSAVQLFEQRRELFDMIMHSGNQKDELIATIHKLSSEKDKKRQ